MSFPLSTHHTGKAPRSSVFGWQSTSLLLSTDPQRLISVGRLITALFAVLAIYFDPTKPAYFAPETRILLFFYAVFALLLAVLPLRRALDDRVHLLTHGIDLVVLCSLALITDELSSPFCSFLPFVLLVTTIRWGLRGALVGAVAVEAVLLIVGWPDLDDGESELNLLIMRSAYFLVAAIMLGYFGASRDLSRQRLERLAGWPTSTLSANTKAWLGALMSHAANVLGKPDLIVVWQDQESGLGTLALWSKGELTLEEMPEADLSRLLDESPPPAGKAAARKIRKLLASLETKAHIQSLSSQGLRRIYSASFSGIRFRGEIFVLDPVCYHEEGVSLTTIISSRIASELERLALMSDVAQSARLEERTRLARDLHDSVLQDLTAVSLKLKAVTARMPEAARPDLGLVSTVLAEQQRRIRHYVELVQSPSEPESGRLEEALQDCAASLRRQWNCDVRIEVRPPQLTLSHSMLLDIMRILSEATANAVRHGGATRLEACAELRQEGLQLHISDNGRGMTETSRGSCPMPGSLAARIADLRGSITISRATPGLALAISLPV